MRDAEKMKQDDILEQATRGLRDTRVPEGPPPKTLADVLATVSDAAEQPPPHTNGNRIIRIKERVKTMRRITKIAAAALIVIGIIAILDWSTSGSGAGMAFADVVRPFLTARTGTFKMTTEGEPSQTIAVMFAEPGRTRWNMPAGETIITDMQQGKVMTLTPSTKAATVMQVAPPGVVPVQNRFNVVLGIRKLLQMGQETEDDSVEFLGEQEIDGLPAIGYRVAGRGTAITVWVDPETDLPIRIEYSAHMMPQETVIISDIAYNVELDESLFSVEPPEGYSVTIASTTDTQPGLVIRGIVTDAATGQPIPGARVSDDGYGPKPYKGAITDSAGKYRYASWPEEHGIVAKAPGYKAQRKGITTSFFQKEKEKVLNFALVRE